MKIRSYAYLALGIIAAMTLTSSASMASTNSEATYLVVKSPDHPETWVTGAHQNGKVLRWDSDRKILTIDVEYSTADYADNISSPIESDSYSLTFPSVRLSSNGKDLQATDKAGELTMIGHLTKGLFGQKIILNKDVSVSVHRVNGKIYASLVYNRLTAS